MLTQLDPHRSLKGRLVLVFGGLGMITAVVASILIGHTAERQVEGHKGQELARVAGRLADNLDRAMLERYRDISLLARLDVFRDPGYPAEAQRTLLEDVQRGFTSYAWIGFADSAGTVRTSTGRLLEAQSVADRPWFTEGLKKPYFGDVHEALLLQNLLTNPTGEPLRFVDIAVPVIGPSGETRGVLGAHLYWQWAKEIRDSLLTPAADDQTEALVLSRDGAVLLGPREIQAQTPVLNLPGIRTAIAGRATHAVLRWPDGDEYLVGIAQGAGYQDYPGLGWLVVVRQSTDAAFALARTLGFQVLGLCLLMGAAFGVVTWVVAGQVVQPIRSFTLVTERIRDGERPSIPLQGRQDEIGRLANSFHQMVVALDRRDAEARSAETLKRYLAPQIAAAVMSGETQVALSTRRKNLTICFCDIRGFTSLSEHTEPEALIELLNGYFQDMTEIIFAHGGTVDKYLGDGILAFFGDPVPQPDHADRAVRMAQEMRAKITSGPVSGRDSFNIGIGISTGYVTVGNIGSATRLE